MMSRRACVRTGAVAAIALLVLLLAYSQSGGLQQLTPSLDLGLGKVRHNRLPLDYSPGTGGGPAKTAQGHTVGVQQDQGHTVGVQQGVVQQQNQPQTQQQVQQTRQQPKQAPGDVLIGENWDKPDPQKLPDTVALNMDDPSRPRRPGVADMETGPYSALKQLLPDLVPSVVHFVWCGQRWFEFKPYLSILSVIRTVKPDKVVLHYEVAPQRDKLYYHSWISDLQHDYPFFMGEEMTPEQMPICHGTRDAQVRAIVEMLRYEGGLYVGESTWLLDFPATNRQVDLDISLDSRSIDGYVLMRAGVVLHNNMSLDAIAAEMARSGRFKVKRQECATATQLYNGLRNPHCLVVKDGIFNRFFPTDIWDLDDAFGQIARKIFYGTDDIMKPKPNYDTLVPNIGHMIWIGGGRMDFVFYLSVLSMLYVLKVETVYIHGDVPPKGPYWTKLMTNPKVAPLLKHITRQQPLMVYQGVIEPYYKALMSDIIRVDIMIKYGGIYADTDAIWVKPLSKEDFGYDAVASFDWVDWSFPYPDSVNFGLSYGKRNAPFWRLFRNSMRNLHNDIHGFTGVMYPYKLLEKYPHLLRIDRHLQVICYHYRCHPTWVTNYHNMSVDHVTTGSLNNWRESVHAFHWTHPNPPELANETALANGQGIFADLGRMVLQKAGLL